MYNSSEKLAFLIAFSKYNNDFLFFLFDNIELYYNIIKKEVLLMKRLLHFLSTVTVAVLTLVITNVANSSSCYYIHQPKEPEGIKKFKLIH